MQADTEEYLREAAGRGHEMVQQMVQKLSGALIYPDAGNVQTNEKLWDVYASEWGAEAGWVAGMAASNRDAAERLCVAIDEDHTRVLHFGRRLRAAEIGIVRVDSPPKPR